MYSIRILYSIRYYIVMYNAVISDRGHSASIMNNFTQSTFC